MNSSRPSLKVSFIPVIVLILMLASNVWLFKDDASYGANQIALLMASIVAVIIGKFKLNVDYKLMESKALESVSVSLQAVLILLIVGSLIGIWILNGVVPSMIYYGIKLIHPTIFLPVTLILCSVVSLATGSSWSTVGTIGIALIGIGKTIGIPEGMVAGAIVSGSYFGDKMSPLSDTTNLAPAMAGTDLFSHIRHMVYTTGPAIFIALVMFIVLGFFYSADALNTEQIESVLKIIEAHFNITPLLFILPIAVVVMVKKQMPAVPALVIGTLLGAVFAMIFQQDLIASKFNGEVNLKNAYELAIKTAFAGFEIQSGNEMIDKLFSRGGMSSMLNTVWLIIMAMIYGGMMEVTGMLQTIADSILKTITSVTSLVASTIASAIFLNITTSDQYISIVVSGRMFKNAYTKFNLHPKNLSRAVEDGATVTSVLIPWNTCGAYFSSVMGVATVAYLPFAFFNILSPIVSIVVAATGKTMEKLEEEIKE